MIPAQRWSRLAPWAVVGLLLLAFALRTYALGERELAFDEVGSVFIAARGPLGLLAYLRDAIREHPPVYYLLLYLWMPSVGRSEFAVRFLSVIIGTATVAATYRLVRKAACQPVALLTTFLLVLSPFHISASRDARMYGLLALCSLLSVFLFIRLMGQDRARWWGLFWLVTGLGMFTHYYMAFVLLAEDLFLLLNWRRYRHLLIRWLAVHVTLGGALALWAALSPGLWATLVSFWRRGAASHARWDDLFRALNGLYLGATLRPNWLHLGLPLALTVAGIGLAQWRNLWLPRGHRHGGVLLGLLLSVPLIGVLALPERVTGRYLTAALPACILAMALAIGQLVRWSSSQLVRWSGSRVVGWSLGHLPLLLLLPAILFVDVHAYPLVYCPPGESFRARVEYLRAFAHPDDGLLLHGPWQRLLLSYYDAGSLKSYAVPRRGLQVEADLVDEALTEIFDAHDRVWVSYNSVEPVDPDWIVSRWLHEHTHQVWFEGDLALYYAAPAQGLPSVLIEDLPEGDGSETTILPFQMFLPAVVRDGAGRYERVERVDVRFGEQLWL
ncbi:MAG: glycosyltransferase family 39 protein, partial [Chloroflexi bacterium]|nr:glycosyltransferase family 39 protein [Chloroflexota bacterium]